MKLIGYARVSTGDQQTIANQVEKMQAYCDLHDHELIDTFLDEGVSGKTVDRTGLRQALKRLSTTGVDGVVITKLDRLSRSVRDWCDLMETFDRKSKVLISVYDSIDTSTASGRMIANMFATIAQWERETIAERTQASMNYLRKQGRRIGRFAPYGFQVDPDDQTQLIPCLRETDILAKIRSYSTTGLGATKIANQLNEDGYTNRSGKAWTRSAVWKIVKRQEQISED